MAKNSFVLDVSRLRKRRLEIAANYLALFLTLFGSIPRSQAGTAEDHQKIPVVQVSPSFRSHGDKTRPAEKTVALQLAPVGEARASIKPATPAKPEFLKTRAGVPAAEVKPLSFSQGSIGSVSREDESRLKASKTSVPLNRLNPPPLPPKISALSLAPGNSAAVSDDSKGVNPFASSSAKSIPSVKGSDVIEISVRDSEEDLAAKLKAALANRKSSLDSAPGPPTSPSFPVADSYRGKNAFKAFVAGLKSDNHEVRYEAIVEMSRLHGPNYSLVGLVFEEAFQSPHKEVREAAEALLAEYPEPGHKVLKEYLLQSPHLDVRMQADHAAPYAEMIAWIRELPQYINKAGAPKTCNNCAFK